MQRTPLNTEAKLLLLAHAFETLDCIAVEFRTHWMNQQSRAAIARLGAKQDGVLRNHQIARTAAARHGRVLDHRVGVAGGEEPPDVPARATRLTAPTEDLMLIDFFFALNAAKLPVSVKEYLTLLEALQKDVIGPAAPDGASIDDFYFLARTALVKDEAQLRQVRPGLRRVLQGVEQARPIRASIPLDWLLKKLERELTPEEKAQIEALAAGTS